MPNEVIIILSIIVFFGMTLLWQRLFGERGLYCWTVVATIAANIEVMILVRAFGFEQTLGNVLFASTFLATDILSENYGKEKAARAVNIGIITSLSFILISQSWLLYSPAAGDISFENIKSVFSSTPRIMLSGLVVYALTQHFDVWLYHKIWNATSAKCGDGQRFLWLRNNAATLASQLLNTVLFNIAAFAGIYDFKTLLSIIAFGYLVFIVTSLADTPFIYLSRKIAGLQKKQTLPDKTA